MYVLRRALMGIVLCAWMLEVGACSPRDRTRTPMIASESRVAATAEPAAAAAHPSGVILVDHPRPGETVRSPLQVSGRARGGWYFEASFPVELRDARGTRLAQRPAQAQAEWMTEALVPFGVELTFAAPPTPEGVLVLHKANASGMPEHDDELRVPVRFER